MLTAGSSHHSTSPSTVRSVTELPPISPIPDNPQPGAALRACLLSGGASRRMGRDKALLPHPCGGTWLEGTLSLLAGLGAPVTLLSGHPRHLVLAERLAGRLPVPLSPVREDPPHRGPLAALGRLMELHRDERLLLCPVDMPWLTPAELGDLVRAAARRPGRVHLAHDGMRLQPLLGIYPSDAPHRRSLAAALAGGELRLQGWLARIDTTAVVLPAERLRNANRPEDLPPWGGRLASGGPVAPG